jgi:ribosomal-protein-alanine N-acetyltransferase
MSGDELETERLYLRRPTLDDLPGLIRIWGDPEVTRYLPSRRPIPLERTRVGLESFIRHWEMHGFGPWSLFHKPDAAWIGYAGLRYLPESLDVELLYALDRAWWGEGLTSEAARRAVQYGFERLALEKIVALAFPENLASIGVMKNAGMVYERDTHLFGHDLVCYSILDSEYDQVAPQ